ncbi:hypothetical protein I8752_28460 [Nostocaceae cyanobacterium CENA369]|uniref:Uncharacterized protein n=1 Tax=Dendronalium phyllosphericum CENA369 TaxID=1725256 RepID=A0A8J7LM14_9NOST|nr:hypothetical protein [Dendronalium phyllosphericum]MBH8576849.1 hypothetical protein [Dendronalium phyllosphericum CENA369]
MSFIKIGLNFSSGILNLLPPVKQPINKSHKNYKIHDYSRLVRGKDYVFEFLTEGTEAQMTGIGKGLKAQDYIILKHGSLTCRYQIVQIDYYSEPSDMWMALLKRVIV